MSTQKGFSITGLVLVVMIVILGIWYFKSNKKVEAPVVDKKEVAMSHCGLTINSPLGGSTISFPLSVNAVVDNTNASELGCSWTTFEAQAGVAKVMNGTTQVGIGILTRTEDWMTTSAVNYNGVITLSSPVVSGTALTLVLEEENPSGEGTPDTLSIPVISN